MMMETPANRVRKESIDLGLALLSILARPHQPLSCADIAAWCDCHRSNIDQIEKRALRKIRRRLSLEEMSACADFLSHGRRSPAARPSPPATRHFPS